MRLMRLDEVCDTAGIGKTKVYELIGEGEFPKPVNLRGRAVRWVSDEIEAWIMERVEERDGPREAFAGTRDSGQPESGE